MRVDTTRALSTFPSLKKAAQYILFFSLPSVGGVYVESLEITIMTYLYWLSLGLIFKYSFNAFPQSLLDI